MRKTLTNTIIAASAVGVLTLGATACSSDDDDPGDDLEQDIDEGVEDGDEGVEDGDEGVENDGVDDVDGDG